jgi:branched-chain amino acid aminotransferase
MTALPIQIEQNPEPRPKPDFNNLGFGKHFTDHIFTAKYNGDQHWHDLKIMPFQNLSLNPAACVLHYGQALFEGMKAYRWESGQVALFRPEFNWKRMVQGSERLCMQAPPKDIFVKAIQELVRLDQEWIPTVPHSALYIRPTLIASEGFLGIRPSQEYLFFIILSPVGPYYPEGVAPVKIWIEKEFVRAAPGGLGSTKAAANYAGSLKASENAKARGFTQVLWLDVHKKYIEEVGTMNVFFVIDDEIVTPGLGGTILGGKTRDSAIQLLRAQGHNVQERQLSLTELIQANKDGRLKEVFGTGTAAVISPVGQLASDDFQMTINGGQTGPISQKLYTDLTDIQHGRSDDPFSWIVKLK